MTRRALGLVLLAWLEATGAVLGEVRWYTNPSLPPDFPPVFEFDALPNGVRPQLFLNPSSIQINLTGPKSLVEKETVEVWLLRKDGTVLKQTEKPKPPFGSVIPGGTVRSFYFEKTPTGGDRNRRRGDQHGRKALRARCRQQGDRRAGSMTHDSK
jgi:hypothetical protein